MQSFKNEKESPLSDGRENIGADQREKKNSENKRLSEHFKQDEIVTNGALAKLEKKIV